VILTFGIEIERRLSHVPVAAQQAGLTDGQIASAGIEVPELVRLLDLEPGMTVADVGAGFGAWTVQFARVVGPAGRVFATDIGEAQLSALRDYAAREGLTNVTVIEGRPRRRTCPRPAVMPFSSAMPITI
jgi:precorrin-6B methylase 2